MRPHHVLGVLGLVVIGCHAADELPGKSAATTAAPPSSALTSSPAPPASTAAASASVTDAEARALLDRWVAAQNDGTFPAYESLYAARFGGVRRSGAQVARLDRASWMRERARMFRQKTTVHADGIVVTPSAAGAEVRFAQTWESGTFKDTGTKSIVFARDASGVHIVREEMLTSSRAAPSTLAPLTATRFAFVVQAPGPSLVLSTAPDEAWAHGDARLVSRGSPAAARREVDAAKLPAEITAVAKKKAQLFNATGLVCEGTITGFAMVGRVDPHFGTRAKWDGTGEHQGSPRLGDNEVAADTWAQSDDGRVLVAELDGDPNRCKGATWGRVAEGQAPAFANVRPADATMRAAAIAELRKLPAYATVSKEYASHQKDNAAAKGMPPYPARWEDYEGGTTEVRVIPQRTGKVLVTASVHAGHGCGSFEGLLSVTWEAKSDGTRLVLVSTPSTSEELVPTGSVDLDGDGTLELFILDGIVRMSGTRYDDRTTLQVPSKDCPC